MSDLLNSPTPGPWVYHSGSVYSPELVDDDGFPIIRLLQADRENEGTRPWERDANCRLAASAPDLLAALDTITAAYASQLDYEGANPDVEPEIVAAREIMAKARPKP